MEVRSKDVLIGLAASIAIYFFVVWLAGFAAAIATPNGYFEWYRDRGIEWLALPLWNLVTVIPAMVIPTFLVVYVMVRYLTRSWLTPCLTIVAAYFFYFYISAFWDWSNYPNYYELNGWRALLPSMWLPLAVTVSGYLANKRITNQST